MVTDQHYNALAAMTVVAGVIAVDGVSKLTNDVLRLTRCSRLCSVAAGARYAYVRRNIWQLPMLSFYILEANAL